MGLVEQRVIESRTQSSFQTPAYRNMSLGAEELMGVKSSEMAAAELWL
jgi:hypothetical protein